jgi:hypothetical protein
VFESLFAATYKQHCRFHALITATHRLTYRSQCTDLPTSGNCEMRARPVFDTYKRTSYLRLGHSCMG